MTKGLKHGYVQIYTGNGKGKTTAALGLAVRACGAGLRVYFCQFIKKGAYSEIKALSKSMKNIVVEQFGGGRFIMGKPSEQEVLSARQGLARIHEVMKSGNFDVVIADEINGAAAAGLLSISDLLDLIAAKPGNVELVLTGRSADGSVIDKADLVTEMREIKHYYSKGVASRPGIES